MVHVARLLTQGFEDASRGPASAGLFLRGQTLGGTVGGFTSTRGAFVLFARATADGVHELRDPHLRPIGSASGLRQNRLRHLIRDTKHATPRSREWRLASLPSLKPLTQAIPVTVGATTSIPLWASWVACIIAGVLAWVGFDASR